MTAALTMPRTAPTLVPGAPIASQLSDAALAPVLHWDDALGLAYRLSPFWANYTELEQLAAAIWWRALERNQLDRDERS